MATKQSAASAEVSEREYQSTLNAAVAATEVEILTDALGGDELDNDGDTSLEDMGDGLEGEVEAEGDDETDEEAEGKEQKAAEGEEGEGEEAETAEADGEDEGEEAEEQPRGQFRDREPVVTPKRLREEAQRARQAEDRVQALERQIAEYNGRITELSARVNTPPPRQAEAPQPKPDMFAEPEKYEQWVLDQAERRANTRLEERFTSFQQQQQQREMQRVDRNLSDAAQGERAFEFQAAYNALTKLDPRDPRNQSLVQGIYTAPDPSKAMFDWWDRNGGEEYRAQVFEQLAPRVQQRQQSRAPQQNGNGRMQPRHEIRSAQRLPSLNSATGSNVQRNADPEMQDGSERSVFEYGTRR